jgi:hypothetical protein
LPKLRRGYGLAINEAELRQESKVPIIFEHRGKNADLLRQFVCDPTDDLLFVSISLDKILDRVRPWFEQGLVRARHVRVLIWQPAAEDAVEALALHLGQITCDFQANIKKAWTNWTALAQQHSFLKVRGYASVPTMNAILTAKLIQVELLPFNYPEGRELGTHAKRLALSLNPRDTPASFQIFTNAFNDLWQYAERPRKGRT